MKSQQGLTALEIIIIVAVIGLLVTGLVIASNPRGRAAEKRNEQRWIDVRTLNTAVQQYADAQEGGGLGKKLSAIDDDAATLQLITEGDGDVTCGEPCADKITAAAECGVDLEPLKGQFLPDVPRDPALPPRGEGGVSTGYYINYAQGIFTIGACEPEDDVNGRAPVISVTE